MKARLNLSTKPLETHRRFLGVSGIGGAVALLLFLGFGLHVYFARKAEETARVKEAGVREELISLENQRRDLEQFFARPENAKLHDRSAFLNTLIDEQSLNWTQMFMDLEKILPAGVRVLSIEPAHEKDRVLVKFIVGASSDEAGLKFVHALEQSSAFSHVALANMRTPSSTAGNPDKTELELTAVYLRTS
jgi:type IV pilus assembly protein PilN